MTLRIKDLMIEKGIKSVDLSSAIGISTVGVSNLINGKINPSFDTLEKISEALNVPIWQLFVSPEEVNGEELTAFVKYKGEFYEANTVSELQSIVDKINSTIK